MSTENENENIEKKSWDSAKIFIIRHRSYDQKDGILRESVQTIAA